MNDFHSVGTKAHRVLYDDGKIKALDLAQNIFAVNVVARLGLFAFRPKHVVVNVNRFGAIKAVPLQKIVGPRLVKANGLRVRPVANDADSILAQNVGHHRVLQAKPIVGRNPKACRDGDVGL